MVGGSFFIGKHKNSRTKGGTYECGMDPGGAMRAGGFQCASIWWRCCSSCSTWKRCSCCPWAVIFKRLPAITGSRMFGFWEMLVYLGFVAVGLFYVWKKGILNWANDKGDL